MRKLCCVCNKIKEQGPPARFGDQVSHGICIKCWGPYRQKLGLPERPYPVPYQGNR